MEFSPTYWDDQRKLQESELYSQDVLLSYISSLSAEQMASAITPKSKRCSCMDERVYFGDGVDKGYRNAGSMVLAATELGVDKVAHDLSLNGITELFTHEECGGGVLAYNMALQNHRTFDTNNPNEYTNLVGQLIADKIHKLSGIQTTHIHTPVSELNGLPDKHLAQVVYFCVNGAFEPIKLGLPDGFVIDTLNILKFPSFKQEEDYAFKDLVIALGIAFGAHGIMQEGKIYGKKLSLVIIGSKDKHPYTQLTPAIDSSIKVLEDYPYINMLGFDM